MGALSKAYLGMQCFWGAESTLAKLKGVEKTRVGYAGGTIPSPNYDNIGDHTEVTEVIYDENVVSYEQVLNWFWKNHDPVQKHKKQYQSAILYTDEKQKEIADRSFTHEQGKHGSTRLDTYVKQLDEFYQAEDYHQKYWLRCNQTICKKLNLSDAEIVSSKLASKVNAFLAGYKDLEVLKELKHEYKLSDDLVSAIEAIIADPSTKVTCG